MRHSRLFGKNAARPRGRDLEQMQLAADPGDHVPIVRAEPDRLGGALQTQQLPPGFRVPEPKHVIPVVGGEEVAAMVERDTETGVFVARENQLPGRVDPPDDHLLVGAGQRESPAVGRPGHRVGKVVHQAGRQGEFGLGPRVVQRTDLSGPCSVLLDDHGQAPTVGMKLIARVRAGGWGKVALSI